MPEVVNETLYSVRRATGRVVEETIGTVSDPGRLAGLAGEGAMPAAYAHAHYIWFVFVGIALTSAISLIIFGFVTRRIDARLES